MKEAEVWLARDRNGKLYLYRGRPLRIGNIWRTDDSIAGIGFLRFENELFPEVQWSDKKPTKVKITIEK